MHLVSQAATFATGPTLPDIATALLQGLVSYRKGRQAHAGDTPNRISVHDTTRILLRLLVLDVPGGEQARWW